MHMLIFYIILFLVLVVTWAIFMFLHPLIIFFIYAVLITIMVIMIIAAPNIENEGVDNDGKD